MDNATKIIELKFDGNGISPFCVKASEVAELLVSYERSLLSVIKEHHPGVGEDDLFVSFKEIVEGSLSLKYVAHKADTYVLPALQEITKAFQLQNYNHIPNHCIEDLRVLVRFTKRHNCSGYFISNGENLASFDGKTEVAYNESQIIKGETIIYGEVQAAGGKKTPRITLRINNDYLLSFEVKKETAKQLAAYLYGEVGLKGIAKWDKKSYRVLDFKVESVLVLEQKTLKETFKDISDLLAVQINNKGDYNSYLS